MKPRLKRPKSATVILIALTAALVTSTARAGGGHGHGHHHHGGVRIGAFIGGPVLGLSYYGYPSYGYGSGNAPYGYAPYGYYGPAATVITTLATQPAYVEQNSTSTSGNPSSLTPEGDWYYCSNPDGYYPYVKLCASGWQRVPPQPINR